MARFLLDLGHGTKRLFCTSKGDAYISHIYVKAFPGCILHRNLFTFTVSSL